MRTQFAGVQYTIDTVVTELADHPEYKFTIVEMAFLYRWWVQASDKERTRMKDLVNKGQLHFVNAGWCMSDEAAMYYEDFIDQMTVGLRWLKETFNYVPSVAWHIDPFGHHSSSASLFSQMGFNSFFFARIDYQDKEKRMDQKALEMIWRPFQYNNDQSTYIFTHVNYYHYSPPPGFCFDDVCRDDPIMDDPTLEGYNIDSKAKQFADYFKSQANHFRTSNLMHTMGEDFTYTNSRMWYKNMDKLIKYINSRDEFGVKILYSTPGDYIEAIHKEQATYPTKKDDFFPYADN
jgi:lysosomal alpha-mannosidase